MRKAAITPTSLEREYKECIARERAESLYYRHRAKLLALFNVL